VKFGGVTALNGRSDQWYVLRVRSRHEKMVASFARSKGLEVFLPLVQSCRHWSDRLKSIELPLFPGYVFCRLNPKGRLPFLTIPGALHFVGVGKIPVPMEETEVAAIQTAVQSGLLTEPWTFVDIGRRVRIHAGPLAGLEGILVGASKQQRLVISVTLLERSIAVAIDPGWATPLEPLNQGAESGGVKVC
jgi:transcription antitermination factor NusG